MIDETDVEKAVDYLRDSSNEAAGATANRKYLDEFRMSLKALIIKEHLDKPVTAQEREAYADERYQKHLGALRNAIHADEQHKFKRHAAEAKIMAWQTQSANMRATKI